MADVIERIEQGERMTPDTLVTWLKSTSSEVGNMRLDADMNFLGCSPGYVLEKVSILETDLKWIRRRIRAIVAEQKSRERSGNNETG